MPRTFRVCGTFTPASGITQVDCRLFNANGYEVSASTYPATANNGFESGRGVWWVTFENVGPSVGEVVVSVEAKLIGAAGPPTETNDNVTIAAAPKVAITSPEAGANNLPRPFNLVLSFASGDSVITSFVPETNGTPVAFPMPADPPYLPIPLTLSGMTDHIRITVTALHSDGTSTSVSVGELHGV